MADALSLVMMTFPQQWDGNGTLTLNLTVLPSVDPVSGPLIGANPATPSFATGTPVLAASTCSRRSPPSRASPRPGSSRWRQPSPRRRPTRSPPSTC